MSSISPHPDGVSGGNPGSGEGDQPGASTPQGGYGTGPSGAPAGHTPGATSSGSAAFASGPPGSGPAPAAPQGYGRPQGPPPGGGYNAPPNPYQQQPGTTYGQPSPYGQPPQSPHYPQHPPQAPPTPPGPPPVPQPPYAARPEPHRDMPMAGASPIRRNLDDTAELPAFLDSARSDESPTAKKPQVPEAKKGVTRKFPLTTGFTALLRHRHALSVLVKRDLAVKYQSTVMGYVWSLIEPLGLAAIYWFVFGYLFSRDGDLPPDVGFPLFIVSGIFAWQWFTSALNEGTKALGGQSALITVMKVPREVFPVSKVFARFAEYVVGFPIIVAMALFYGGTFGLNLLWLIPAVLVEAMLLTGIVFILAALNVLYKDVQRFLGLVTRILFYASAIIFPVTVVAEQLKDHELIYRIFSLNPLVGIFQMHRAVWIPSFHPDWYQLGSAVGFAVFFLFFGRWIFYRMEPRVLKAL